MNRSCDSLATKRGLRVSDMDTCPAACWTSLGPLTHQIQMAGRTMAGTWLLIPPRANKVHESTWREDSLLEPVFGNILTPSGLGIQTSGKSSTADDTR